MGTADETGWEWMSMDGRTVCRGEMPDAAEVTDHFRDVTKMMPLRLGRCGSEIIGTLYENF